MAKFINETFKDYQMENNLKLAEIKELKLHKKENALQLDLISDNKIELADMISFEDYAIKKFSVNFTLFMLTEDLYFCFLLTEELKQQLLKTRQSNLLLYRDI